MIEALVIGRVGVDLTPTSPRTSLASAASFTRAVGGFSGNIGTALARLGVSTAVIAAVGDDGHGQHVRTFLADEGVDVSAIVSRRGSRTQVAFFEVWPPERFPVTFYRSDPAPETGLTMEEVPAGLLASASVAVISGTLLASDPARGTVFSILEARRAGRSLGAATTTILDLDWRPTLWGDPVAAPALLARAARLSDVVIGSDLEFDAVQLAPEVDPEAGPDLIVLKHGADGVGLVSSDGRRRIPGIAVDVLCGIGSGDALTASVAAGLIRGLGPFAAIERGNAAGAIVATRLMCSNAMPTDEEIDRMLANHAVAPTGTNR